MHCRPTGLTHAVRQIEARAPVTIIVPRLRIVFCGPFRVRLAEEDPPFVRQYSFAGAQAVAKSVSSSVAGDEPWQLCMVDVIREE